MSNELTLEDLKKIVKDLESVPRREFKITVPASDHLWMTDEQFTAMCRTKGLEFWGGSEMVNKMKARIKKLNIK